MLVSARPSRPGARLDTRRGLCRRRGRPGAGLDPAGPGAPVAGLDPAGLAAGRAASATWRACGPAAAGTGLRLAASRAGFRGPGERLSVQSARRARDGFRRRCKQENSDRDGHGKPFPDTESRSLTRKAVTFGAKNGRKPPYFSTPTPTPTCRGGGETGRGAGRGPSPCPLPNKKTPPAPPGLPWREIADRQDNCPTRTPANRTMRLCPGAIRPGCCAVAISNAAPADPVG